MARRWTLIGATALMAAFPGIPLIAQAQAPVVTPDSTVYVRRPGSWTGTAAMIPLEPLVNLQGEGHPYIDTTKIVEACRQRGIVFTAYCPLGRGRLFDDPVLGAIAKAKGRSLAQVALRWLVQRGNIVPIPRSSNPGRLAENLDVFSFTLSDDEMARIGALKRADGRIANPPGRAPTWD